MFQDPQCPFPISSQKTTFLDLIFTIFLIILLPVYIYPLVFTGGSDNKESTHKAGDLGLIPGSGRSPAEEDGYPLQDSCLGNPMDRGAWWATVHGVAKSQTRLST